ncbi:hypothetical protein DM558_00385 [Entomomonas moraniae]|uniref:Uncharacterized protein n=1 Tax=Entomomonas moraniae TaxID=2213226 RepID=A0A3Q9JK50_9GAMM|nr:hypothetical protein DM558_00385 [Entomomonas moraniae]
MNNIEEDILDSIINCCQEMRTPEVLKRPNGLNIDHYNLILNHHKISEDDFIRVVRLGINKELLIYNGNINQTPFDPTRIQALILR